jgi:hypothetical protein
MLKLHRVVLTVALAILVIAGCSEDKGLSPSIETLQSGGAPGMQSAVIGPSEIVMCVDVSDSISAEELISMVSALKNSISNTALIPQDGLVSVSALVYGDTINQFLTGPLAITADNLTDTILPAFDGLLTDRIVGGTGFYLSGALQAAADILGASSVSDRHVFVIGSGEADDPAAVETVCQSLGDAGVMVTAIGVGPTAEGAALLEGCTEMTGGFYGSGTVELEEPCAEALAYMLQVDIDLEPESLELQRNEDHSVTAKVFRGGNSEEYPIEGIEVTIAVTEGPNLSESVIANTNANGAVTLTYNGDGGPGIDMIIASAIHPGTGTVMTDTVTVTWINDPPVCDPGCPTTVVVESDTATVNLDGSMSSDAEGDSLRFFWSTQCEETSFDDALSATPVLTITGDCLCIDTLAVDLMVSDGFDTTYCTTVIIIDDQRPPIVEEREEPLVMWPPNHKYQKITPDMMLLSAVDACGNPIDVSGAEVLEVRSDEPDDANGDGKTIKDIRVECPNTVHLRRERMGGGNGRVYTIIYRLVTDNGAGTDIEVKAIVPHDASGKPVIEDEGGGYVIVPECIKKN